MKNTFVLYADRLNVLEYLSDEQAGVLLKAIYAKVTEKPLPEMDGMTRIAFCGIETRLEDDARKYEEVCEKRREAGRKGGTEANASKCKQMLANASKCKQKAYDTDNDTDTDNDLKREGQKRRFTPPSLQEVKDYCVERNNNVSPENFINFYTAKDWMVGKNKMRDWKAAVRTWEQRGKTEKNAFNRMQNNAYDFDALEAVLNG